MSFGSVRVRFAPSPTGIFHVGGARSALFNWVVARQSPGGRFVLRIEDTDVARNRPEWMEGIVRALAWLGISQESETFEGPYFQSSNAQRHGAAARQLFQVGRAYYCACTREEVVARASGPHRGYDGRCRELGLPRGEGRALRFRTPDDGVTAVADLIRGATEFPNAAMEDFVIARGDGSAVFLLANAVDDLDQRINLVIRGEEHLSNAAKQQLLWEALGATPPRWAHVPVIVNEKRQKLSKRRDRVALEDYQAEGYLAETMRNYLMLLGWAPGGDREIVPWSVIEAEFRLENVNSSPAQFDVNKLRSFNGEYIRTLPLAEFVERCQPWLTPPAAPWPAQSFDEKAFAALAPLAQTRVGVLSEITTVVDWVFLDPPAFDEASWSKAMKDHATAGDILRATIAAYQTSPWEAEALKTELERVGNGLGLKLGKAQAPVRVAVMSRTVGLPLFESLTVLGRERTLARLRAALDRLRLTTPGEPSGLASRPVGPEGP
ncbi:MAG TPA: glutamate--tRNA ligase [Pseudonocardiaceae bacterium]